MKISRSQQKLENKGFILGLLASVVLHAVVISGAYFYKPKSKEITPINITKIDLGFFEVGGGVNDAPPSDEISEILEQNIIEELKEESIEEEVIQEEAVEEVIEEETIEE